MSDLKNLVFFAITIPRIENMVNVKQLNSSLLE